MLYSNLASENYINVTAAIIRRGKEVLITKRGQDQPYPGRWEFPGGKIEPGEKAEDCLAREILEELGVKIQVEESFFIYEHDYNRPDGKKHRFFSFWCKILEGEPSLRVHDDLAWIRINDLPNFDFIEADKQLARSLLINGVI